MTYLQMLGTRYANFMPTALLSSAVYAQVCMYINNMNYKTVMAYVITVSACIKIYYYSTQNLMMLPLDFLHYMIVLPHHGITSLHEIRNNWSSERPSRY